MKLTLSLAVLMFSFSSHARYCKNRHTPTPPSVNCSAAEKVINGDFEDNAIQVNNWQLLSSINGWTPTWVNNNVCGTVLSKGKTAMVEIQSFTSELLPESNHYVELDSDCQNGSSQKRTNVRLEQFVEASVGEKVRFQFNYKARTLSGGKMQMMARFGNRIWTIKNLKDTNWKTFSKDIVVRHSDLKNGKAMVVVKDTGDGNALGMFVDNVSAKATNCQAPTPVTCSSASQVISYLPLGIIPSVRKNASNALGLPNGEPYSNDNNVKFTSLGFGGSIVLKMDAAVKNNPGPDLRVFETTGSNHTYSQYKEEADVYGSNNLITWTLLGRVKNDNNAPELGNVELGSMSEALYIKIVDRSAFVLGRDGFDVDSVTCVGNSSPVSFDSKVYYLDKNAQKVFKVKVVGTEVHLQQYAAVPYSSAHLGVDNDDLVMVEATGTNRISSWGMISNVWDANHLLDLGVSLTQVVVKDDYMLVNDSVNHKIMEYDQITEQVVSKGKVYNGSVQVKLIGGDMAYSANGDLYMVTQDKNGQLFKLTRSACNCGYDAQLIVSNLGKVSGLAAIPSGEMLVSIVQSNKMKLVNLATKAVKDITVKGDLSIQGSGGDLAN